MIATPLAVTQEDFLVILCLLFTLCISKGSLLLVLHQCFATASRKFTLYDEKSKFFKTLKNSIKLTYLRQSSTYGRLAIRHLHRNKKRSGRKNVNMTRNQHNIWLLSPSVNVKVIDSSSG